MIPYTQLRKDSRLDLAATIPLPAPLTVYIEPTNRCNLSCDFCPQSLEDYKERAGYWQHMPVEMFAKIIDEIKTLGIKSVKLYFFGEPLLHPQIGELVRLAKTVCHRVELTTNGIPLNERRAKELIAAGLDYLRVSLYNEQPERVRENVKRLHDLRGITPHICVKIFSKEEADAAYTLYAGIADEVSHETLHSMGSDLINISQQPHSDKTACPYPFYTLVVKANGDVVPCCVAWEQSLVVGNVENESLLNIWKGDKLANIHKLHLEGRRNELAACAKCDTLFNSPDSVEGVTAKEYEDRVFTRSFIPGASYGDDHVG